MRGYSVNLCLDDGACRRRPHMSDALDAIAADGCGDGGDEKHPRV